MPKSSADYWRKRAAERMVQYQVQADKTADILAKAYVSATNQINNEIERIFANFSGGRMTETEALKLLNNLPNDTELANLKDIIKSVKDSEIKQDLLDIVNAPAYAYRIKRFQALQTDIEKQIGHIAKSEQAVTKAHYVKLTGEAFNRTVFDIQKGTGIGFSFSKMPKSRIEEILKNNWSGKLFSERIWGNAADLNIRLQQELLVGFLSGRSGIKTAKAIEEKMAVGAMEARRLVRTESTYIANMAELDSYRECGIEKFEFVATLDMRTSPTCQTMDGKQFPVDKAVPGTNVPPLHPWCRSTTVAVIDGAVTADLKRRARDPKTGKTYEVPADMTYEDWKKSLNSEENLTNSLFGDKININKSAKTVSNFNSLSEYLDSVYGIKMKDSVKRLDFETVRNSIEGVETVISEYSDVGVLLKDVVVSKSGVMSCTGETLSFNPKYFADKQSFLNLCKQQSDINYWIPNSSPQSIGVHEAAHGVEWVLIQANPAYEYDFQKISAWNNCSEAKTIVSQACKNIKKTSYGKGKLKSDLIKKISRYALCSDSETMAEAFADVYANGSSANPLSVEIKRLTAEQMKKYKRSAL